MAEKTEAAAAGGTAELSHVLAQKADKGKYVLLAVVVVLVAVVVIIGYVRRSQAAREVQAGNKVFQSIVDLQGSDNMAAAVASFGQSAKEFSGMAAGAQAQLLQFAFAYNSGDYVQAEQAARNFLKDYPRSTMVPRAKLALGQSLIMQDKTSEAIAVFRPLSEAFDSEVMPEAKLALAQALEKDAESVRNDPAEYRVRLEKAEQEYNDIIVRSQIPVPSQRGYWAQAVVLPAEYSLALIKDRLAGHEHKEPGAGTTLGVTAASQDPAQGLSLPAPIESVEPAAPADADADGGEAGESESESAAE